VIRDLAYEAPKRAYKLDAPAARRAATA
jgi:hypothetical protein